MTSPVTLEPPIKPPPAPEVERIQQSSDRWMHEIWLEAMRTMLPQRWGEFTAALMADEPPPWMDAEIARLDAAINARGRRQ